VPSVFLPPPRSCLRYCREMGKRREEGRLPSSFLFLLTPFLKLYIDSSSGPEKGRGGRGRTAGDYVAAEFSPRFQRVVVAPQGGKREGKKKEGKKEFSLLLFCSPFSASEKKEGKKRILAGLCLTTAGDGAAAREGGEKEREPCADRDRDLPL